MRSSVIVFFAALLTAAPLFAQTQPVAPASPTTTPTTEDEHNRGYMVGSFGYALFSNISGFSTSGMQGTPNVTLELGVKVISHIGLYAEGGWMANLQSGIQPALVATTTTLYTNHIYIATGEGKLPVWYGVGGAKITGPTFAGITLYALGGAGIARLVPSPKFLYVSGTLPGVPTQTAGADETAALTSGGYFTPLATSSKFMWSLGGGAQMKLGDRYVLDARYRYSRISADAALGSSDLTTNAISLGFGLRF